MSVVLLAIPTHSLAVVVGGVVLAGCGQGAALVTSMGIVLGAAPTASRGATTAALYVVNYIGFGIPVLACGIAADHLGLAVATVLFAAFIAVVAALALVRAPSGPTLESLAGPRAQSDSLHAYDLDATHRPPRPTEERKAQWERSA